MPGLLRTSGSSSSSDDNLNGLDNVLGNTWQQGDGDEYPAVSFPGYAEKPLEQQLEPIAVIGMGCRLPGDVKSATDFWNLMINKGTGQTPKVPASRFNIDAHYHKNNDRPGSFGVLGGYFLEEDLSGFDPGLFGITPIEAMWMDPQQRKLLEVVYEALESGGITLDAIAGTRTAVFAASFTADWQQMAFKEPSFRHSLAATGVDPGIISNRISHVFNLNGPSIVVNTACSSSVYALHNACNALRNNECEGAIVGGVNLIITVDQHMNTAKLGVLSPTSTCHTFDASADGYGRADAVGAVYLKRLSDAIRDGDPIRGVIRSSATNSNGKVPAVGITHPNRDGQADVISHAYKRGGDLDPRLTGYFECHGTGTAVGDPLEVHAVSLAMNKDRDQQEEPLLIGAVKTNIGHSEAASGLSALIKAILIVERGRIPPTRGVVNPSPGIKWADWQVKVPTEVVPFPSNLPVRRVSINSFGYGGTNAHVIVEGADSVISSGLAQTYKYLDDTQGAGGGKKKSSRRAAHRNRPFFLPFSAHDKATLQRNIDACGKVAQKYDLVDLSYTLAARRSVLASKSFTVASHRTLEDVFGNVTGSFISGEQKRKFTKAGFVFTGQGAQWARMGADLIKYSSVFLGAIRNLDHVLEDLHDGPEWTIEDILLEDAGTSPINQAEFSQPLCTAVQIALVQQLADWGIRPVVTVGHSSGEIAAAYAANLITAREAITAAYYRGLVTRDVKTDGSMLAVGLGADEAEKYLTDDLSGKVVVACHNSPGGVTLSGDADAIEAVKSKLDAENVFARLVKTNGKAYHSHHMAPVAVKYEALVRAANEDFGIVKQLPKRSDDAVMVSSVTNEALPRSAHLDEKYWSRNLRSPVLFNQAVQTILTSDEEFANVDVLIEIGPHSAMSGPIKQIKAKLGADKLDYLPTLLRGEDSAVRLLKVAGELWLRNYPLEVDSVVRAYTNDKAQKGATIVDLPPYQWNYTRPFWAENRTSREQRQPKYPRHDTLGQLVIGSSAAEPTWRNVLRLRDLPWLRDHSLGGESVFPAAGYFSMAIEAITQLNELSEKPVTIDNYVLRDVSIKKALVTPDDDDGIEVLFNLRPSPRGREWYDFSVSSIDSENVEKEHMAGSISINTSPRGSKKPREVPNFPQRASLKAWNQALREVGFDYGPTFQDMDDIRFDGKRYEASSKTAIKQHVDESLGESRYVLHPATVDSVLQLSIAAIHAGRTNAMSYGVVPIQVDEVTVWAPTDAQLEARTATGYAWVPRRGVRSFEGSAQITANDGELVLEIVNVRTTSYEAAVPQKPETTFNDAAGPYGELVWSLDIDALDTAADVPSLGVSDLVDLALFKYPGLKVLELGSGYATNVLRKHPQVSYTVLVEEQHIEATKEAIKSFKFAKPLALESIDSAEGQSTDKPVYDVVIATSTDSISPSVRRLLKPQGYTITGTGNGAVQDATTIFGGKGSTSVYRASGEPQKTNARDVQLVYRSSQKEILAQVKDALEGLGWNITVSSLDNLSPAENVVILADFEGPLLFTLTEAEFSAIQSITNSASSLLWVTTGGLLTGKKPEYALVQGLARSVASEQASLDFRTLDVDLDNVTSEQVVQSIVRVALLQATADGGASGPREREFSLSNGKTFISRLARNQELNKIFTTSSEPESTDFTPGQRVSGRILTQGKIIFEQSTDSEGLEPSHVEVEVKANGLIKEGVLVINGSDYPTTFSHEIGGVVVKVGAGVTKFQPGDKVFGFNADTFSSFQTVSESLLHKLGPEDDLNAAVGSLVAYTNALYGLETLGRVKANDIVLILHRTGASGVAAVRVAQAHGAIPYVQAHTSDEVKFLRDTLGLDERQILHELHGSISTRLDELTNNHGADIVFSAGNAVDQDTAADAWRGIARFGRFVDPGRKDVLSRTILDTVPIARGASYLPFDLLDLYEARPEILSGILTRIPELLKSPTTQLPLVVQPVELADIDIAVASFSESFDATKPVVQFRVSDKPIQLLSPRRSKAAFNPDFTYLLVGCLGGLGRSLTAWMMQGGARRFSFLSRSGTDSPSAAKLVRDIEAAGAIVQVIRGDATSRADVVRAVQSVPSEHPIRGVVHAAMVLRDGLFHSMSFENWKASTAPKVAGVLNLHSVLSGTPLAFFLSTSSVSGILGTPGQSNYAAANSFLDAISRHRVAAGEAATSIVLPMILGVGVVAENTEIEDALRRKGIYGIDEEQLLESFEAALLAPKSLDHVVSGLDPAVLHGALKEAEGEIFWQEDARFSSLTHVINTAGAEADAADGGSQSILATVKSAPSLPTAVAAVTEHFIDKLARMLLLDPEHFEPHNSSIASYGIDSMIGAELRNWIFKEYRIDIPFQQLLAPTLTIDKFSTQVCAAAGVEA